MPTIRWNADGHEVSAGTWRALERELPRHSLFDNGLSRRRYRRAIRRRARSWAGVRISVRGDSRRFITEMERAAFITIERTSIR